MPFSRPTVTQIVDRVKADFKTGLGLTTVLRRKFIDVFGTAFGGASHTLHGHLQDYAENQLFPDQADEDFLIRHSKIWGVERLSATFAQLNITITGTPSTVVAIGTLFSRADGFQYALNAEVTIGGGGSITGIVTASFDPDNPLSAAGSNGNIDDGSTITLTSPIGGVDAAATVDSAATEGEDEETIEALRTRLLQRIQNPPAGGKVSDYIAFALGVVGVTRVWVLPNHLGQGTVGVTFVEDGEVPIFPGVAKVAEVQEAVDEQKPVTADVYVFAPNETSVDMTISLQPNTQAVRDAVTAEIEDLFFREAEVRDAADPDKVGLGVLFDGRIALSKINEAISVSAGEEDHVLVTPVSNPQAITGGILTVGTITFETLGI